MTDPVRPDTAAPAPTAGGGSVLIDCDRCVVRGPRTCGDCFVTVLLGVPGPVEIDAQEQDALAALSSSGLVPPLRMVTPLDGPHLHSA